MPDDDRAEAWWENAVIYQVAPWSFQDSNGDGRGDLRGVVRRMDDIADLGVDALWLTPIFSSPMDDLGYDVEDLDEVGDAFGTEQDLDDLLAAAHERGLRVMLDMVWSHTSDRHPWFLESRSSRASPKADWYVWADPAPDGGPPNNWRSVFSGESAWIFSEERGQYHLANFLASQPDVNWHHPDVRRAILERARYWLERGIDGMRLDAVNFFCHDPDLADNPPRTGDAPEGIAPDHPAAEHRFENAFCRPETVEHLAEVRRLADEFPGTVLLGEVTLADDSVACAASHVGADRLHLAYHSALHIDDPLTPAILRAALDRVGRHFPDGGGCWIVGNHDYGRTRSHWSGSERDHPDGLARLVPALAIALPGPFCLWQGDELGLPEARVPEDIPPERLRDPFGRQMYPEEVGRDGSRTPMPWRHDAHQAGFTTADEPWLPIPASHLARAVDLQRADPGSLRSRWAELLRWRRTQPAVRNAEVHALDADDDAVLVLERRAPEQRMVVAMNLTDRPAVTGLGHVGALRAPHEDPSEGAHVDDDGRLHLDPWGVAFLDAA